MLGKLVRELPGDGYVYEPKWDGFRCLVFRSGEEVDLRSRNDRPLARYFPELVDALRAVPTDRLVLDGEILAMSEERFDFTALMARLHPAASRVERLRLRSPAVLVAFDLLAIGEQDLTARPFRDRRAALEELLAGVPLPLSVTPATDDRDVAAGWLERFGGGGIDGVVAKRTHLPYQPGARAMLKVKRERTADCVVAGFRVFADRPLPSSLLLGFHDPSGELRHVGLASSFSQGTQRDLLEELLPLVVPLEGHPWEHGFLVEGSPMGRLKGAAGRWSPEEMERDWVPVAPVRVCEVAYDHLDGDRFRHPARFRRWRPDRDPSSCRFEQLMVDAPEPRQVLALQ